MKTLVHALDQNVIYYSEPTGVFRKIENALKGVKNFFEPYGTPSINQEAKEALSFDELNPLLAKQLSEVEAQLGHLAKIQFEMAAERKRMKIEMQALMELYQRP